jgi:hypothetical protein
VNEFIIILLDLSYPTHDLLFYIYRRRQIKVGCMGPCLCNEYIEGLDAFIDFIKKDILDNVRGNL